MKLAFYLYIFYFTGKKAIKRVRADEQMLSHKQNTSTAHRSFYLSSYKIQWQLFRPRILRFAIPTTHWR